MNIIISVIDVAFQVLYYLILARVLLSFIKIPYNPIIRFIYEITEPVLAPFRRLMPRNSMVDFSPLLAWLVLSLIHRLLLQLL